MPLDDDLDRAVDHFDSRLVVDGLRRTRDVDRHGSAWVSVLVGKMSRCGKIEKSTTPGVISSGADGHSTK